ncbi:DUF3800 domain-containing protein [Rhodoferax sp.]|uniref:DUF3800 domain-containing protein n=1 Tax=Rhodoferax sp. TaxID=50421 RepID=UPI00374D65A6
MATTHYFVDEAGDTTLFGRYGKVLANTDAVSRFFMVARLEVDDIGALQAEMDALRAELMADPLLKTVPSMQAAAGKTALFFHAKDDVPEVRHAVFKLLLRHDLRLSAVVKEKQHLLAEVHRHQAINPKHRYKADGHDIYDDLIARLFGRFGEFGVQRHITFAVRGSKPRTAVLKAVLDNIDEGFKGDFGFAPHGHTTVHSDYPSASAGLQACDYLLWALQRFYERSEERYLHAMWPKFTRVLDLDAPAPKTKGKPVAAGVAFNEKHPLTLESRAGVWKKDREI